MERLGPDFDAFVQEHSATLLGVAVLLTADRGSAEDLLQVALLRTARRWAAARHNPAAYSRRVLVNLAKDNWRNRSRRPREVSEFTDVLPAAGTADAADERLLRLESVSRLVSRLPIGQRKVLVLRYFADLSVAETAVVLDCSEGTVKSQTNRALNSIRALLEAEAITDQEDDYANR
jgi:RNA polymerase sigma-70 factor (sigma-E family)